MDSSARRDKPLKIFLNASNGRATWPTNRRAIKWTDPLRLDSFSGEVRMPAEENRRDHGRAEEVLSGIQAAGGGGAAQWGYNSGTAQSAVGGFFGAHPTLEKAIRGRRPG